MAAHHRSQPSKLPGLKNIKVLSTSLTKVYIYLVSLKFAYLSFIHRIQQSTITHKQDTQFDNKVNTMPRITFPRRLLSLHMLDFRPRASYQHQRKRSVFMPVCPAPKPQSTHDPARPQPSALPHQNRPPHTRHPLARTSRTTNLNHRCSRLAPILPRFTWSPRRPLRPK